MLNVIKFFTTKNKGLKNLALIKVPMRFVSSGTGNFLIVFDKYLIINLIFALIAFEKKRVLITYI